MVTPVKTRWPLLVGLWSLLWRAVLLTPFAILLSSIWLIALLLVWILPVCEVFCLYAGEWFWAAIYPLIWIPLFLVTRTRWFKGDRKDFLNGEENI